MTEIEKIPEASSTMNVTISPPKQRREKKTGAFVDLFMTALIVALTVAIIATYFIQFDLTAELNVKKVTVNTVWFAIGTFSIGALGKRVSRRKGERTKEYEEAEKEANEAIKTLNESEFAYCAGAYGENQTREAVRRFRRHELTAVGISEEDYENKYLGKGVKTLFKDLRSGNLSFLQYRAIRRCNKMKIKAYDPNFITSYNATSERVQTASDMIDVNKMNRRDDLKSVLFTIGSAFGIGFMFSDVMLDFSAETLFEAIIKIVMIGINLGMKASYGWNLSVLEIRRNKLRASEARACLEWAKRNKELNDGKEA